MAASSQPSFGLIGLAVMGQNFALNVAEHGFDISVYNRSGDKTDDCVRRAQSSSDCTGQLSPLLSTLPAVQVVTATGRGHHAAHIGRHETIVAHAEALVHA